MALTAKGKKLVRNLVVALVLVAAFFGLKVAKDKGFGKTFFAAVTLDKSETKGLTNLGKDGGTVTLAGNAKTFASLPSNDETDLDTPEVRFTPWAWNANIGCLYSNGGPVTTKGSLMEKHGVKMRISRQDDNNQLMAGLTKLAKNLHDTPSNIDPTDGTHFISIMGDGSAAFLAALNSELIKAFGPDYRAEVVGSCGYSHGEDKLYGPKEWKDSPQSMRGSLISTVVRDGDWAIVVRYAIDNQIPVNPQDDTYDPDAINFVNAKDYIDAANKYVAGYCETRSVVKKDGKPTGEKKQVCVQGTSTWTPGDVTAAKEKGGGVSVISTKEYANQMPNVVIGIHKWNQTHRPVVEKILAAFGEGGDQVLTFPKALDRAAEISQEVYQEQGADANYWKRYYLGVREKDKTGNLVDLGGSKANNLADAALLFGLAPGSSPRTSRFNATYTVFGGIVNKMYPQLVPHIMPVDSVLDLSYLKAAVFSASEDAGEAQTVKYAEGDSVTEVVGRRGVAIEFATGSATPTPAGERQLADLLNDLTINSLRVVINGHTDNVGNADANLALSERRAQTVKAWLERRSPANFPSGRIQARGFGDTQPVANNSTASGRQSNRRVEIVLGQ